MLDTEFAFHWEHGKRPFEHLRVASMRVTDAMSAPYEVRLRLHARGEGAEVDPEELVGSLATVRLATHTDPPVRCLHGLIAEAEEVGPTAHGMLYEVTLVPPLLRAAHRIRSRIFLEKTTAAIIEAVLLGDPDVRLGEGDAELPTDLLDPFQPPEVRFVWRIQDTSRITDPATRPYCVQYNESDHDFVARLLEEEGISYHFEHTGSAVVMVMSDHDGGRASLSPFVPLSPSLLGRQLGDMRLGRRLRAGKVTLVDYNWKKPALDMQALAAGETEDLSHTSYPGLYPDAPTQGEPLARARLERLGTEARFASAQGACRLLGAGSVFPLAHPTPRYEGEYLVTRAEIAAEVPGELPAGTAGGAPSEPFVVRVECVRRGAGASAEASRFRPERRTRKPLIAGSQTAVVTDDPSARGAEIHVGGPPGAEIGCVRLKFHWDLEAGRHEKEATSAWVRVGQTFAGAGGGSVWHPRVGTEVIVDFLDGDPDRPIVTGRVYNGTQLPPALGKGAATGSIMKSLSSPGGGTYNEVSFDDTAGKEHVGVFAGKDMTTTVGHDRAETVTNDSTSGVLVNRTESTGADRKTSVTGSNTETIDGAETLTVSGRQNITVSAGQDLTVTADRNVTVTGPHTVSVGPEGYTVNGASSVTVTAAKSESVGAALDLTVGAAMTTTAGAPWTVNAPVATVNAPATNVNSTSTTVVASGAMALSGGTITAIAASDATLQGASVAITAAGDIILSGGGSSIKIGAGGVEINGGSVKIAGGSVDITGGTVKVN